MKLNTQIYENICSLELIQEKLQKCSLENVPKESSEQQTRAKLKSAGSLTSLAKENTNTKTIEPIYAVVNLKNKYAHRQQQQKAIQEQETHLRRCNSYDSVLAAIESQDEYKHKKSASYTDPNDIEAIYEDGEQLLFSNHHNKTDTLNNLSCADCELENIYEPVTKIDVRSAPRKTLWRYITQLKVTPFLQLKNSIGSHKPNMAHYESIEIGKSKSSATTKHLSTLRLKFGTHRRSMQLRMRKLFKQTKKPQHSAAATNHNNNNNYESCYVGKSNKNHNNNKKPKSKYRLKINKSKSDKTNFVPQKRFFGSLKHLRKPSVH